MLVVLITKCFSTKCRHNKPKSEEFSSKFKEGKIRFGSQTSTLSSNLGSISKDAEFYDWDGGNQILSIQSVVSCYEQKMSVKSFKISPNT